MVIKENADLVVVTPMDIVDKAVELAMLKEKQYQVYRNRIEVLRSDAQLDGFAMNEASEVDFWSFIEPMSSAQKAGLVLLDNGNLRAV